MVGIKKRNENPADGTVLYLWRRQNTMMERGPFTLLQVKDGVKNGVFEPFDLISRVGEKEWKELVFFEEFFENEVLNELKTVEPGTPLNSEPDIIANATFVESKDSYSHKSNATQIQDLNKKTTILTQKDLENSKINNASDNNNGAQPLTPDHGKALAHPDVSAWFGGDSSQFGQKINSPVVMRATQFFFGEKFRLIDKDGGVLGPFGAVEIVRMHEQKLISPTYKVESFERPGKKISLKQFFKKMSSQDKQPMLQTHFKTLPQMQVNQQKQGFQNAGYTMGTQGNINPPLIQKAKLWVTGFSKIMRAQTHANQSFALIVVSLTFFVVVTLFIVKLLVERKQNTHTAPITPAPVVSKPSTREREPSRIKTLPQTPKRSNKARVDRTPPEPTAAPKRVVVTRSAPRPTPARQAARPQVNRTPVRTIPAPTAPRHVVAPPAPRIQAHSIKKPVQSVRSTNHGPSVFLKVEGGSDVVFGPISFNEQDLSRCPGACRMLIFDNKGNKVIAVFFKDSFQDSLKNGAQIRGTAQIQGIETILYLKK